MLGLLQDGAVFRLQRVRPPSFLLKGVVRQLGNKKKPQEISIQLVEAEIGCYLLPLKFAPHAAE
jgi:hypothetical protein